MKKPLRTLFLAAFALATSVALAHDFWLEPMRFTVLANEPIDLSIKVGTGDNVETLPWMPVHVSRCFATNGDARIDIDSEADRLPAATFKLPTPGTWTIAYDSFDSRVELEPEKFEAYLRDEGLEKIIDDRKQRGESAKKSRELYSRCAKTLIRVLPVNGAPATATNAAAETVAMPIVQLPLELVAESDPYAAKAGAKLGFRLVLRGQFLEGALVQAKRLDHSKKIAARTDKEGRVEFDLGDDRAAWMLTAVYMERAPKRSNAEWKSLWATLAFELDDRTVKAGPVAVHEGKP